MEHYEQMEAVLAGLGVLLTIIGALALIIFRMLVEQVGKMSAGVAELNVKIAVIIEQVQGHERRIETLESTKS